VRPQARAATDKEVGMMKNEKSQGRGGFQVLCVWCGAVIRHDGVKESRGMCLECYARMLHDYNRRDFRADAATKASQR
jgi:hypothetical protein